MKNYIFKKLIIILQIYNDFYNEAGNNTSSETHFDPLWVRTFSGTRTRGWKPGLFLGHIWTMRRIYSITVGARILFFGELISKKQPHLLVKKYTHTTCYLLPFSWVKSFFKNLKKNTINVSRKFLWFTECAKGHFSEKFPKFNWVRIAHSVKQILELHLATS